MYKLFARIEPRERQADDSIATAPPMHNLHEVPHDEYAILLRGHPAVPKDHFLHEVTPGKPATRDR